VYPRFYRFLTPRRATRSEAVGRLVYWLTPFSKSPNAMSLIISTSFLWAAFEPVATDELGFRPA
jgi:hypothetical protein